MTYGEAAYELVKAYDAPENKTVAATVAKVHAMDAGLSIEVLTHMTMAIDAYVDSGKLIHHGN